jgi:CheY-like chemotaxis protein
MASRTRNPATPTILVVDDEPSIRAFACRVLNEREYVTAVAGDGHEALAIAPTIGPIDLLLTDVVMPGMNGDELARQLCMQQPNLKVLYFTGFSDRLFKDKGQLWDGEAFLEKPCTAKGLLEAVSLLLSGHATPKGKRVAGRARQNAPRPPRVSMLRARVQLANTVVDVVNVSSTGMLVRVMYELPAGSEWPLLLEWPSMASMRLQGRVVRCERADTWLPGASVLQNHYEIALTFVDPSPAVQAILDDVCRSGGERVARL